MSSKIEISCTSCGKKRNRFPSQVLRGKWGQFCSNACIGVFRSKTLTGPLAANFKTGATADRKYIEVLATWHPNKNAASREALHRIIAEARLGRFLVEGEIVHHKDGDATNNHWDNLEVMTQAEHARKHKLEKAHELSKKST